MDPEQRDALIAERFNNLIIRKRVRDKVRSVIKICTVLLGFTVAFAPRENMVLFVIRTALFFWSVGILITGTRIEKWTTEISHIDYEGDYKIK